VAVSVPTNSMTDMGIAVIAASDVMVPALLAAWLIVLNVRHHRTQRTEVTFWFFAALALALPALAAVHGIVGIPLYEGHHVISTTLLSFPGSLVPIIATVPLSDAFFDDGTWASVGYFVVMPLYLAGTVLWQLLVIVAIRRLAQLGRRRERQTEHVGPHPANRAVANRAA
jgi:uncharacterized membrane protein